MNTKINNRKEPRELRCMGGLNSICQMLCDSQLPLLDIVETDFQKLICGQLCGISAEIILENLCKANGWDLNKVKSNHICNSMHNVVSVDEQIDAWFIDNPVFDNSQIDTVLEEKHFVDFVNKLGSICEIFEDKYGAYFHSRNYILTFAKTSIGYVFLGVYRVYENCVDGQTVQNYYKRVCRDYPLPTARYKHVW